MSCRRMSAAPAPAIATSKGARAKTAAHTSSARSWRPPPRLPVISSTCANSMLLTSNSLDLACRVEVADGELLEIRGHELTVCARAGAVLWHYLHLDFHESFRWNERPRRSVLDRRLAKLRDFKFWEIESHATVFNAHWHGDAARSRQRGHRSDGTQAIPESPDARRIRPDTFLRLALFAR